MAATRRDRLCREGLLRHRRAHRAHLDQGADRRSRRSRDNGRPPRAGPCATICTACSAGSPARCSSARAVTPSRASMQWSRRRAAPIDVVEADRGRSAHRVAARFRHAVGGPAGGQAARARMKTPNTILRATKCMTRSASSTCRLESSANFRWRGTSASWSMPRTTAPSCCARRSTPNANHKGTAFGGSLFCVAVLTGWAWATRYHRGARVERRRRDPGIDDPLLDAGERRVSRGPEGAASRARGEVPSRCWRVPDAGASACTWRFWTVRRSLRDSTAYSWRRCAAVPLF